MKKHTLSKRFLSLLLSALMIVTSVPLVAIPVSAAATTYGSGVMSEYLTDSNMTGFTGTATWDNTMKAWSFDGSKYLKLTTDSPLANASVANGFAVSFDVYHNDTDEYNSQYFRFDDGGSNAYIMNAADTTWYWRYRSAFQNSTNTREYYTSDFNADYCTSWVPTNGANGFMNDMVAEGKWYNFTMVMNTDGAFEYFIDGVSKGKYKTGYESLGNGHGITDANVTSIVQALSNFYIGASDANGNNGFRGYIKNFKFINGITANSAGQLALLMNQYEAKMNGTVYTNMAAAYKAYVDANEAYDAAVYGNSSTAQVTAAYSALQTAMSNMTAWSAYTGTANAYLGNIATGGFSNILAAPGEGVPNFSSGYQSCGYLQFKIFAPAYVVMYYDGNVNNAYFPFGIEAYATSGSNRTIQYAYLSTGDGADSHNAVDSDFVFRDKWRGYQENSWNGTYGVNWSTCYGGSTYLGYTDGDTSSGSHTFSKDGDSKKRYFVTSAKRSSGGAYAGKSTFYVTIYNSDRKAYKMNSVSSSVYVVDYNQVKTAIAGKTSFLSNVSDYKEGQLSQLMENYDDATSYDITSYFTSTNSSNVGTCYSNAENAAESVAAGLNTITSVSTDSSNKNYIALRNAIDYSGEPSGLDGGDFDNTIFSVREVVAANGKYNVVNGNLVLTASGAKTLTGYEDFSTAYTNAKNIMAALGTSGYNTNATSNYTDATAATKADALTDAFDALSAIDLNKPTSSGNTYLGPADLITVTDTNEGDATYTWQYSTDNGTSWVDGGSVASAGGTFAPFSVSACVTAGTVKIRVKATKSTATEYDNAVGVEYTYLAAPSITGVTAGAAGSSATITAQTTGLTSGVYYSIDDGAHWTEITSGNSIAPFELNGNVSVINVWAKQINNGSTSAITKIQGVKKQPAAPSINVDSAVMDASHGFTLTNNCTETDTSAYPVTLYYSYDNSSWTQYTSGTILPFENDTAAKTIYAKAVRNGLETATSTNVTYLFAPSYSVADNTELTAGAYVNITNNAAGGTVYYRLDGGNWVEGSSVQPFNGSGALTRTVQAKVVSGNSVSTAEAITVIRNLETVADVYFEKEDGSSIAAGKFESESGDTFKVASPLSSYTNQTIYYQASVDGGAFGAFTAYNINSGIPASTYSGNQIVTFKFYITNLEGKTVVAQGTFYNNDTAVYNELAFQESFDGASVSGSTLTLSNGATATASNSGASIVEGAGWVDSNGNSPDWRNDVLKINGYSGHDGYYKVTLNENPLANSATAAIAAREGVTISFWRYVPGGDGNDNREVANVGYWTPAISFNQDDYHYFDIMQSAYTTRSDGAVDGDSNLNKYVDIKPDVQDYTGHATGNLRNRWLNIVVTIDPANGVTVYTNGEPHNTTVTTGTGGSGGNYTGNNAALAADIISFITNASTDITLADGHAYWSTDNKDLYLDDIRIYTGVKTQVDINNMYIDEYADVQSVLTSTSHDPTNVTVYTLAAGIAYTTPGGTAKTTTAGQQVGQEFLDYYGISANDTSKVTAVDYYSFGTGLTVYHWNKTTKKWDVVGDSAGRCGYQNQGLFGAEYTTALSDPLAYAGTESNAGAGYLVWAPHVMYNLVTDHWMYYGSTSSWGSQKSAIFYCENTTNDSVTGPYSYQDFIYKSTSHPNAIDACVYYKYVSDGNGGYKPDPDYLYLAFGSWGGANAIASKALDVDGGASDYTSYQGIICRGIDSSLEGASDGGSGEGAYIVFENGYYYLYVAYGQNTGSYVERVFRSTSPNSGFVDLDDISATDSSTYETHGNQILGPFDMSNYDYLFVSTGHNSVYKGVNDYGEIVSINSVHARPNATENHNMKAVPDGALATAQYDPSSSTTDSPNGNVNLVNQIAYTSNGWPVMMPFQYDGTDTVKASTMNITAADLEGVYAADDLQTTEYYNWAGEYRYTIIADEDDETGKSMFEYGTDDSGDVFTDYIVLSTGADGTQYANYYASKDAYSNGENPVYYGVVGTHGTGANKEICITMICSLDKEHTWTYRIGDIPSSEDVSSLGDSISMDGVIYTHLANDQYTKYGHEISDNFTYGQAGSTGERFTSITTTYPAKIDVSNPTAVYCLSDEALAKQGYSGGDFSVVALNDNKWFDAAGNKYTDAEAIAADGVSPADGTTLQRRYGIQGYVSNYYFDSVSGTYRNTGVELIVSYNDVETGASYSEFEFCYVSYNPSMAHTVVGIRNTDNTGTEDMRYGLATFARMEGSYGSATSYSPVAHNVYTNASVGETNTSAYYGTGNFNYLYQFPNTAASINNDNYTGAEQISNSFDYYSDPKVGSNSGSFGLIEHKNSQTEGNENPSNHAIFTESAKVVNADYYIDYSDDQNSLITYSAGKPTGYSFNFYAANLYWPHYSDVENSGSGTRADSVYRATSFVKNATALGLTTSVTPTLSHNADATYSSNKYYYLYTNGYNSNDGDYFKVNGTGITSANQWLLNHQGEVADTDYQTILKTMTTDGTADYTKLTKAFTIANGGYTETAGWQGTLIFTGTKFQNIAKATGETAEAAHNFAYEQGLSMKRTRLGGWGASSEQTFHYYNIGVSTCDKGAARTFADKYLNKQLDVTNNADGTVTVNLDANGAPTIVTDGGVEQTIDPQYYTLASYQEYIDAIAELAWFVEAPTNTTFGDYWGYDGNADSTHYITAYTASGDPIYNTTTAGDNIFDENVLNVNTDEVQAQLIQKVIDAYEDLFRVDDYTAAEDIFGSIELLDSSDAETSTIADVVKIAVTSSDETPTTTTTYEKADYTADSWADFVQLVVDEANAFRYYTSDADKQQTDIDFWRRVELSGSEYRHLTSLLENVSDTLLPVVDVSTLTETYNTKMDVVADGIYNGGAQAYTMASWEQLNTDCAASYTYLDSGDSNYALAQTATIDGADVVNGASNEADFDYTQGRYAVTGVTKYTFDGVDFYARTIDTTADSAEQTAVNTENTRLAACNLVSVDSVEAYSAFDTVNMLLYSLNLDKYTAEGQSLIEALKTDSGHNYQYGVYGQPSSDVVTAYNAATGEAITTGTYLRLTTSGGTDPYIAALKSQLSNLESSYVRQLNAELYVSEDGAAATKQGATQTVPYGGTFSFDLSSLLDSEQIQGVSYQIEYYNTYSAGNFSDKTATNNTWVKGSSIELVADNNIKVIATITSEDSESAFENKLTIYNAYRHPLQIVYTNTSFAPGTQSTLTYNDGTQDITVDAPELMFYDFANWRIYEVASHEYSAVPMYNTTGTYSFDVSGGTISAETAHYDEEITLSTSVANFVAWAAVKDNKYQIISYNPEYSFYTVTNESFVVIVKDGSDYKVYDTDTVISSTNIDSTPDLTNAPYSSTGVPLDADAVIKHKLANKYPFVSVVGAYYNDIQTEGQKNKARIYLRVTDGASGAYTAGAIASNIPGVATTPNYKATNILPNGQCSITVSRAYGKLTEGMKFTPYINYDFTYNGTTVSLTDNTATYTVAANANI